MFFDRIILRIAVTLEFLHLRRGWNFRVVSLVSFQESRE